LPGVEGRREEDEDAPPVAGRRDVGGEISWMVRVDVDAVHAAGLTARLEPAARAAKLTEHASGLVARVAAELDRGQGDRGVLPVMVTRDGQLDLHRLELVSAHAF